MARIIFKDKTERLVTAAQLQFILGIKNIKSQIFTYLAPVDMKKQLNLTHIRRKSEVELFSGPLVPDGIFYGR